MSINKRKYENLCLKVRKLPNLGFLGSTTLLSQKLRSIIDLSYPTCVTKFENPCLKKNTILGVS